MFPDSAIEVVMRAERLDGSRALLAGLRQVDPGMLMAAARLDLASAVFLYAGSIAPGWDEAQRRHRKGHPTFIIPTPSEAVTARSKHEQDVRDAKRINLSVLRSVLSDLGV
jgi:dihydroxyacid dehydratase/phosphogluconate dehydratase